VAQTNLHLTNQYLFLSATVSSIGAETTSASIDEVIVVTRSQFPFDDVTETVRNSSDVGKGGALVREHQKMGGI